MNPHVTMETFILLKNLGFNMKLLNEDGENVLMVYVGKSVMANPDLIIFLKNQGLSINQTDVLGNTVLLTAAWNPYCLGETLFLLLKQGANIDQKDMSGRTALMLHLFAAKNV